MLWGCFSPDVEHHYLDMGVAILAELEDVAPRLLDTLLRRLLPAYAVRVFSLLGVFLCGPRVHATHVSAEGQPPRI